VVYLFGPVADKQQDGRGIYKRASTPLAEAARAAGNSE